MTIETNKTHPIPAVIGDHHEQLGSQTLLCSLGDQHMIWPPAAAEVELALGIGSCSRPVVVQVTEGALEGDGD